MDWQLFVTQLQEDKGPFAASLKVQLQNYMIQIYGVEDIALLDKLLEDKSVVEAYTARTKATTDAEALVAGAETVFTDAVEAVKTKVSVEPIEVEVSVKPEELEVP